MYISMIGPYFAVWRVDLPQPRSNFSGLVSRSIQAGIGRGLSMCCYCRLAQRILLRGEGVEVENIRINLLMSVTPFEGVFILHIKVKNISYNCILNVQEGFQTHGFDTFLPLY